MICQKCCCCVPLRYGLIAWGYFKLIASLTTLILLAMIFPSFNYKITASLGLAVLSLDIILHIVFIIGGHKKNILLLRIFYYYTLGMMIFTATMCVVCTGLFIASFQDNDMWFKVVLMADIISCVVSFIMQICFVFLLRSEIIKLRSNCPYRYVKNAPESEGAVTCEGVVGIEKDTEYVHDKETS